MATPEAKKRRTALRDQRKAATGQRKATFWLGPEAWERLEKLARQHGSKDKALNVAILALPLPDLTLGQRVTWKGRRGVVRQDVLPHHRMGAVQLVNIRFDDASDDGPEWRPIGEVEPEA